MFQLLSLFLHCLSAQYAPQEQYDKEAIFLESKPFVGNFYVQDGIRHRMGFMGKNLLKDELQISPNAIIHFKKCRRNKVIGIGLALLSGAMLGTALIDGNDTCFIASLNWIQYNRHF